MGFAVDELLVTSSLLWSPLPRGRGRGCGRGRSLGGGGWGGSGDHSKLDVTSNSSTVKPIIVIPAKCQEKHEIRFEKQWYLRGELDMSKCQVFH